MSAFLDDQWFERAFEALQETLRVDPRVRKEIIQFLFDEGFWDSSKLTWEAGETRFTNALNRNKTDVHFKLGEIWAVMKRFGRHHFALAMMDDLGYECRRKPTAERQQDLLERALAALERSENTNAGLRADIARLTTGAVFDEAIRPAAGATRPQFCRSSP